MGIVRIGGYSLFSVAITSGALLLIKRRSLTRAQEMRECPHCKSIIGSSEPVCENCHRKVIFS